ncbi:hypothetical protein C0992_005132 [Termitomyces sp. T32_za158]|nr:hypothetical protein C0992_005132 [Termitomyces sp. T32_za158]
MSLSRSSSLTPLRSPSPSPPTQPDHFYGAGDVQLPPSPSSDGKTWLDPEDDPLAHRGIPVFRPTMEEFRDFEGYVSKIECWGMKSGIVKIIPPKEWRDSLPPLKEQLVTAKIRTPIEQHMFGSGGRFRQENMEKRRVMSTREWAELCAKDEFRAPGVGEVGLQARSTYVRPRIRKLKRPETGPEQTPSIKEETLDAQPVALGSSSAKDLADPPPNNMNTPQSPVSQSAAISADDEQDVKPKANKKRVGSSRQAREAALADRASQDLKFLATFDPHKDWLPPNTTAADYTPEFCQILERHYWRNCSLGKSAWYGADTAGTLFTDDTTVWNVGKLPSALSRLLPPNQCLPGVNTPYLYFGMWRATFAWHVEDMDLFSINYIHFGAPKFWYAIPQGRAGALEQAMKGFFPKDSKCSQFLRHKSFLASPTTLAQSSCRPNFLVQHSGEFVITFPRGYHAGFNLGFNCAESVNFALESWLELGRRAKACECVGDSVTIDVDQLLADRAAEAGNPPPAAALLPAKAKIKRVTMKKENDVEELKILKAKSTQKRKPGVLEEEPKAKKLKIKLSPSKALPPQPKSKTSAPTSKFPLTIKLGPRPAVEPFPCCLCISMDKEGLLRVYDPPIGRKDIEEAAGNPKEWMAHEYCAQIIPETWVDEIELRGAKEKVVYGVDGIVRDRWHLKCSACTKNRPKVHGAPIQCTKGKCSKAFHVSCARDGAASNILYNVVREVEKEVLLVGSAAPMTAVPTASTGPDAMQVDSASTTDAQGMSEPTAQAAPHVLKTIKKFEVQVLCPQHNPVVAAAKKEAKQDKIKAELMALPEMARIKLRVSSGVFEVSLIRVIEATSSVEVLWDKGEKREFKWSSVIFGNTDVPVQQKPTEMAVKPEREYNTVINIISDANLPFHATAATIGVPAPTYSSAKTVVGSRLPNASQYQQQPVASTSKLQAAPQHPYGHLSRYYPSQTTNSDYWRYQNAPYSANPYVYSQYFPVAGSQYSLPYAYQGQNPYQTAQFGLQRTSYQGQPNANSQSGPQPQSSSTDQNHASGNTVQPPQTQMAEPTQISNTPSQPPGSSETQALPSRPVLSPEVQQALYSNLAALSSLQPDQFGELLKNNPHLRDVALAAIREVQKS